MPFLPRRAPCRHRTAGPTCRQRQSCAHCAANKSRSDMNDLAAQFQAQLLTDIPLTRSMQLQVAHWDGDALLRLSAPLAPNINDKGCAFGGSMAGLLTLAGWGLIVLHLRVQERDCDVYVQDSSLRYLAPVWSDFFAEARLADGESWAAFDATLQQKGRARLCVNCRVPLADGSDAVTFEARFVAKAAAT